MLYQPRHVDPEVPLPLPLNQRLRKRQNPLRLQHLPLKRRLYPQVHQLEDDLRRLHPPPLQPLQRPLLRPVTLPRLVQGRMLEYLEVRQTLYISNHVLRRPPRFLDAQGRVVRHPRQRRVLEEPYRITALCLARHALPVVDVVQVENAGDPHPRPHRRPDPARYQRRVFLPRRLPRPLRRLYPRVPYPPSLPAPTPLLVRYHVRKYLFPPRVELDAPLHYTSLLLRSRVPHRHKPVR